MPAGQIPGWRLKYPPQTTQFLPPPVVSLQMADIFLYVSHQWKERAGEQLPVTCCKGGDFMPEFANAFSGLAASRKLTQGELVRAIRYMVAAEYEAVQLYMQLAESIDNEIAQVGAQGHRRRGTGACRRIPDPAQDTGSRGERFLRRGGTRSAGDDGQTRWRVCRIGNGAGEAGETGEPASAPTVGDLFRRDQEV